MRRADRRRGRGFNFLPRGLFTRLSAPDEQIETLVERWRDLENPRESCARVPRAIIKTEPRTVTASTASSKLQFEDTVSQVHKKDD